MGLKISLSCGILAVYMLFYPIDSSCLTAFNSTTAAAPLPMSTTPGCTVSLLLAPFTTGPLYWLMPAVLMMISLIHGYHWFTRSWDDDFWEPPDRDITRNEPWNEEPDTAPTN